jgi:hypothetical protein
MKTRTSTFSLIADTIFALSIAALLVIGTLKSAVNLVIRPDREPLLIALDWLMIVIFVAAVVLAVIMVRRILANAEQEEAERVERKAELHATIRASHAEPAEFRQAVDSAFEQSARRAGQL